MIEQPTCGPASNERLVRLEFSSVVAAAMECPAFCEVVSTVLAEVTRPPWW